MLKKYKYHVILLLFSVVGFLVLHKILNSYEEKDKQNYVEHLQKSHSEAVMRVETGINIYSTIVSSIRSYIQNNKEFPSEKQLQSYLKDLIEEIDFKDSIVISWVDSNEVFQYCITPKQIDPFHLKGINVSKLRPQHEIDKLNKLMHEDSIKLFAPINLIEGYAAFPFNFAAKDYTGKSNGYIAPVLNVKYLLDYTYKGNHDTDFVHRFLINDSIDLSREAVFDHTKINNKKSDPYFYKNFKVNTNSFIYNTLNFYGLKIQVGTAYKYPYEKHYLINLITYAWFLLLFILSVLLVFQVKANQLKNINLEKANKEIQEKNEQLQYNVENIKLLIKEVHHRVKNNMQIISSLLNLQYNEEQDEKVKNALEACKGRIQSMALVHQKLYATENLKDINFKQYTEKLVDLISETISNNAYTVTTEIVISSEINLNLDTSIPLGLILNELITNSYKHALSISAEENKIRIEIQKIDASDNYKLVYSDSGKGIEDLSFLENPKTLGVELITILTKQLKGKLSYSNKTQSTFTIDFKEID